MTEFLLVYALFLAAHGLQRMGGLKRRVEASFGRGGWVALYSLLSTGLLVWLIDAALRAPRVALWIPGAWTIWLALLAMPVAFMFLVAGAARPNPVSVSFRHGAGEGPGIAALYRHPVLIAFLIWSLAHLAANGDLALAMLFGGFALFCVLGVGMLDRRAARNGLARPDVGPLGARLGRALDGRLVVELIGGLLLYAIFLEGHAFLFKVSPVAQALATLR